MAAVHTFCFVFSLRLGAIIIASVTLVTSAAFLIFYFIVLDHVTDYSLYLQDFLEKNQLNVEFAKKIYLFEGILFCLVNIDLRYYIIGLISFYALMSLFCIFLLMGAYKCKPKFMYPFLICYIAYMLLLFLDVGAWFMYNIRIENNRLGIIISYCNVGFFVILFYAYTWVCVYSFINVIKDLRKKLTDKIVRQNDVAKKAQEQPYRFI